MKILIAGASGFLGQALIPSLVLAGHEVKQLVRREPKSELEIRWDPDKFNLELAAINSAEIVINLCGENVGAKIWNPKFKQVLYESRIKPTRTIAEAILRAEIKPRIFLNASAVGYYGNTGSKIVDEAAAAGSSYLAALTARWEEEAMAASLATRVVLLRFGIILSPTGGVYKKIKPIFNFGVGGILGSGKQYMPWISLRDALRAIQFAIHTPQIAGPVNIVALVGVTNREFTQKISEALHRPALIPVPSFILKAALSDMATETVLLSQQINPGVLRENKFVFLDEELTANVLSTN